MILPYPIAYLDSGIMLFYFAAKSIPDKKYKFIYDEGINDIVCLFGEFAVPVSLLKNLDLTKQTTIYFMNYDIYNTVADYIGNFKFDEQFIIEMKVQIKLQEIQQASKETETIETVSSNKNNEN